MVYLNKVTMAQHRPVKGDPASGGPIMVRMHAVNIFTPTRSASATTARQQIEPRAEISKEGAA